MEKEKLDEQHCEEERKWYFVPNKKLSSFSIISFGEEQCKPLHARGMSVCDYWILHYVVSGKGVVEVNGKVHDITASQCFILRPFEHFFYQAHKHEPWHYIWISFRTDTDMSVLDGKSVIRSSSLYSHFTAIMQAANMQFGQQEYLCARMWDIMSKFMRKEKPRLDQSREYIEKAKSYIETNLSEHIKVSDISNMLGLERSYFSALFKTKTGVSPLQYILEYRMSKAYELISEHGYIVSEAAVAVGYDDTSNFSRAFKSFYGYSPSKVKK